MEGCDMYSGVRKREETECGGQVSSTRRSSLEVTGLKLHLHSVLRWARGGRVMERVGIWLPWWRDRAWGPEWTSGHPL